MSSTTIKRAPYRLSAIAFAVSVGVSGFASADTLSVQGSFLNFEPGSKAETHAISCDGLSDDCDNGSVITDGPHEKHHSRFDDSLSGAFKWTHQQAGPLGADDIAIGGSFNKFTAKGESYNNSYDDSVTISTPYGTIDSSSATGQNSIEDEAWFANADVELGWNRKLGNADVRYFAGVRAEYFEYEREATLNISSSDGFSGDETSKFYGVGPRIGASLNQPIANKLSLLASLSGGAMYGRLKRDYSANEGPNSDTAETDGWNDKSSNEWVPFADAEIALSYQLAGNAAIDFGYQYGYQDDVILLGSVCTDSGAGVQDSSCNDDESKATTEGVFLRLTVDLE